MDQNTNNNSVMNLEPKTNTNTSGLIAPKSKSKKWLWWIIILAILATVLLFWQNLRNPIVIPTFEQKKFNRESIKPQSSKNLANMVVPAGFPADFPFAQLAEEQVSLNQTDLYVNSIVSERKSQTKKTPEEVVKILENFFSVNKWRYQFGTANKTGSQTIIAFDEGGGTMTVTAKIDPGTAQTFLSFYANKLNTTK